MAWTNPKLYLDKNLTPPCKDCGLPVEAQPDPRWPTKHRCGSCDRKKTNRAKTERMTKRRKDLVRPCSACERPMPAGTHGSRKVCLECQTDKNTRKAEKARQRRIDTWACIDCSVEYALSGCISVKSHRCVECARKAERGKERRRLNARPEYAMWVRVRKRAKREGIPFDLKPSDINIPENCPVFGTPLLPANICGSNPMMPSLDRDDPIKGYVKGNVTVMSFRANSLKNNATADEILALADYFKGKNPKKREN